MKITPTQLKEWGQGLNQLTHGTCSCCNKEAFLMVLENNLYAHKECGNVQIEKYPQRSFSIKEEIANINKQANTIKSISNSIGE